MKKIATIFLCLLFSFSYGDEERRVALLFLTRSDLNHTHVWKEWIGPDLYTVYNHCKSPVTDAWFSQFEIPDKQRNEWGYLMLAQQALLKEALKDPRNVKFVFLSESCIPLRTGREVYDILVSSESSHMRWYEIWWSDKSRRNLHEFPEGHRHGNHQWIILNRKHAQMIAEDNYWIHLAMKHFGSDESYPSTFFSMCGVLHEFKNELTTYVDWSRGTLSSPYTFSEPTEENLRLLLDAKSNAEGPFAPRSCLFARKISADFPENAIDLIIRSVPAR